MTRLRQWILASFDLDEDDDPTASPRVTAASIQAATMSALIRWAAHNDDNAGAAVD